MSLKRLLMEFLEVSGLTYSGSLCDVYVSLCRLPVPPIKNNKKMENVFFEIQQPFDWEIAKKIIKKEIDGNIYLKGELSDELIKYVDMSTNPNKPLVHLSNVYKVVDIQDLYFKIPVKKGSYVTLKYNDGNSYICRVEGLKRASYELITFRCDIAVNQDGMCFIQNNISISSKCKGISIATEEEKKKLFEGLSKIYANAQGNFYTINMEPFYSKIANPADKLLELDKKYLRMAYIWAENSYCTRRKVGAIIVKDKMIISDGYNGTPAGFENVCELEDGTTKPYVLHAEANAITKLAKSHNNSEGATLYVTTSPCMECSKLIIQAGIRRVVYCEEYSHKEGLEILQKAGVELVQIKELN